METKKPKGFGYVLFLLPEHAVKAYKALDGSIFQGRILHLLPAKEKLSSQSKDGEEHGSFKSKKKAEMKSKSTDDYNWNSLFMSVCLVRRLVLFHRFLGGRSGGGNGEQAGRDQRRHFEPGS